MDKQLVPKEDNMPSAPGIGIGGVVFCPFGFTRAPCMKSGCEMWVELNYVDKKVGRCALAWNTILQTEVRREIELLRHAFMPVKQVKPKKGGPG